MDDDLKRVQTELMVGIQQNSSTILAATNAPWNLKRSLLRHFKKCIYIPLPDAIARTKILQTKGKTIKNSLSDEDWVQLGNQAEGYSASDCAAVIDEAQRIVTNKCQSSEIFRKTVDGGWTPTTSSDSSGKTMGFMDVKINLLRCPPADLDDLMQALSNVTPSVIQDDIQKYI